MNKFLRKKISANFCSIGRKFGILLFYLSIILFFLFIPKFLIFLKLNVFSDNTINIYAFTDIISSQVVEEFEKETGIKVRLKYFDTNEDLYAKFKVSRGEGYDLITVSDYMIDLLRKDNLLQPLDHSKLKIFKNLDKRLLSKYFDPGNIYSIPYVWLVLGIIYNKDEFKDQKVDWNSVFRKPRDLNYKICIPDDELELVFLTSIYLFGRVKNLTTSELKKVETVLIEQKKWIESYTFAGSIYFLSSGAISLAVIPGNLAKKIIEENDKFEFTIPDQGSLMSIENLAIPVGSKKSDLVYKLINFMLSKKNLKTNVFEFGYNPANKTVYNLPSVKFMKSKMLFPPDYIFDKLHLIHNDISLKKVNDIWLKVRAS